MRSFFLTLGLLIYPLLVHGLVMLGVPWIAVVSLVVTSVISIVALVLARTATRQIRWLPIYAVLAALGAFNVLTDTVYALFLPPVIIHLGLMYYFGATLRRGERPLIERFMRLESNDQPPRDLAEFARRLTWIWTIYFGLVAALSALLAWAAPLEIWSLFINVINFGIIAALFLIQHYYRRRRFGAAGTLPPWHLVRRIAGSSFYDSNRLYTASSRK